MPPVDHQHAAAGTHDTRRLRQQGHRLLAVQDVEKQRGIDIATDKRAKGTGWGHVSAASPILVNRHLFFPIMNGTVYVIDAFAETLDEKALVAINDLGPAGETWTLASFSYANGRLWMHTMKEVICIGTK